MISKITAGQEFETALSPPSFFCTRHGSTRYASQRPHHRLDDICSCSIAILEAVTLVFGSSRLLIQLGPVWRYGTHLVLTPTALLVLIPATPFDSARALAAAISTRRRH